MPRDQSEFRWRQPVLPQTSLNGLVRRLALALPLAIDSRDGGRDADEDGENRVRHPRDDVRRRRHSQDPFVALCLRCSSNFAQAVALLSVSRSLAERPRREKVPIVHGPLHSHHVIRHLHSLAPNRQPTNPKFLHQIPDTVRAVDEISLLTHHPTTPLDKMKFLKVGRVAIITRGRYAGKKVRNSASSLRAWGRFLVLVAPRRYTIARARETRGERARRRPNGSPIEISCPFRIAQTPT